MATTATTMRLTERPDLGMLREAASHPDVWASQRNELHRFADRVNPDETVEVTYSRKDGWARFYPVKGMGLSATRQWRKVRAAVYHRRDIDVDIVNAHPAIALALARRAGVVDLVPNFAAYVHDRKAKLKEQKVAYDWAKKLVIACLNGCNLKRLKDSAMEDKTDFFDKHPGWAPCEFWTSMLEECEIIRKTAVKLPEAKGFFAKHKVQGEPDLWSIFHFVETEHVLAVKAELERRGVEWSAYVYDGFQTPRKNRDAVQQWIDEGCPAPQTERQLCGGWDAVLKFAVKPWCEPLQRHPYNFSYDKFRSLASFPKGGKPEDVEATQLRCKGYFESHFFALDTGVLVQQTGRDTFVQHKEGGRKIARLRGVRVPFVNDKEEVKFRRWLDQWDALNPRSFTNFCYQPPYCVVDTTKVGYYERWIGWEITKVVPDGGYHGAEVQRIYDHLRYLGEDCDEGFGYIKNWTAHVVQFPGRPTGAAPLYLGPQGSGKSGFWGCLMEDLIGREKVLMTESVDAVLGRFNQRALKHFVGVDEICGTDTHGKQASLWKSVITEQQTPDEKKGIDTVYYPAVGNFAMFSNSLGNTLAIEKGDRRYVVFQMGEKKPTEYYDALYSLIDSSSPRYNPQVIRALYDDLMSVDLSGFKPQRDRYISETYRTLQEANKSAIERWLDHEKQNRGWQLFGRIPTSWLHDVFKMFCKDELRIPSDNVLSLQSFGTQLSNLCQRGGGVAGLKRAKQWRHDGKPTKGFEVGPGFVECVEMLSDDDDDGGA